MPILSALDAISPAFGRTKLILFSPFRSGRTWKLAATGYLSIVATIFLPYFLVGLFFIPEARQAAGSSAASILVVSCILLTLVYLVLFYLCSRLRFAFFDIVLNRGQFVAPAWRRYGTQSLQWTLFKVLLGTVVLALVAVPLAAWIRHLIPLFAALPIQQQQQMSPQIMSILLPLYGIIFLLEAGFALYYLLSSLLSDFIVPSLALEDTTLTVAFHRFGQFIRREPGQFLLYTVLKVGLAFAAYIAVLIAFYLVLLVVVVVIGMVALLFGLLLHLAHVPTAVLMGLAVFVGILCYLFVIFYAMVIGMGTVFTFLESYTLYFLSGRYPLLGELLARSTPPPTLPPAPPYTAYFSPPPTPDPLSLPL